MVSYESVPLNHQLARFAGILRFKYRQTSNISRTNPPKLRCCSSRLTVVFAQSIEVDKEDADEAAPA